MNKEPAFCVVCAWRKDCQKKFLQSADVTARCPDFSRDVSIKDEEKKNDSTTDHGRDS
jgi:hypothetical protein